MFASPLPLVRQILAVALVGVATTLAGCGAGGAVGGAFGHQEPPDMHGASWTGAQYVFGQGEPLDVDIEGAPEDTDYSRWALLHDGSRRRLYFMRAGSPTLYQFALNPATGRYEFGFDSISTLEITGMPSDADMSSFAMLHDGADYRLYVRGQADPRVLYQAAFNAASARYEFGFRSIDVISTTGAPGDADFSRWAMLHDGMVYRQYVARAGTSDTIYQFGFDGRTYDFGHDSIPTLAVVSAPDDSNTQSFAMLHDGNYRFFHLTD